MALSVLHNDHKAITSRIEANMHQLHALAREAKPPPATSDAAAESSVPRTAAPSGAALQSPPPPPPRQHTRALLCMPFMPCAPVGKP